MAAAERPVSQHADLHGGTLHNPQPPSQPDADAGAEVPPHAAVEADDSWQLCPLSKVDEARLAVLMQHCGFVCLD